MDKNSVVTLGAEVKRLSKIVDTLVVHVRRLEQANSHLKSNVIHLQTQVAHLQTQVAHISTRNRE